MILIEDNDDFLSEKDEKLEQMKRLARARAQAKKARTLRYNIVLSFGLIFTSFVFYFLGGKLFPELDKGDFIVKMITIMIALTGIAVALMSYVREGNSKTYTNTSTYTLSDIERRFEQKYRNFTSEVLGALSDNQNVNELKGEIKRSIDDRISQLSEETIIGAVTEKFKDDLLARTQLSIVDEELRQVKFRIKTEIERLTRYGYINLMLGFITTGMAIYILGASLLNEPEETITLNGYIYHFLPRLSFAILVEFFSFFFLKLFKKNFEDIKYYNNERTNIEMRIVAIKTAFLYDNKEAVGNLIVELAKTERNFILRKDESTVELEKVKSENINSQTLINTIMKLVDRK